MAIQTTDFVTRLSGGAANAVGNASIGGAKSSVVASTAIDGLFDAVAAGEAVVGRVEYRCVYLHNANATDPMINAKMWVQSDTPLAGTALEIGVGAAVVNATETAIADEATAPAGVVFSAPASAGAGLSLGTILAGQHKSIWFKRNVTAGAGSSTNDPWSVGYNCETA